VSIERGCTNASMATCTNTAMSKGVEKHVCEESCQDDGCNTGWRMFF